jgi:CRP-like cAMP-binding protein
LALKLNAFTRLSSEDQSALSRVCRKTILVPPRRDLIKEGERPRNVHLVLDGWAARYKDLPDGKRQMVGLFVPGDFCDLNYFILARMDHTISAISRLKVAVISPQEMEQLTAQHPRLTQALLWHELVSASIEREWLLNIGQRSAYARIAHLLVEIFYRLSAVGLTPDHRCDFPLTQSDLAEASGLTAVHVNRTLQQLRADGLVELERKQLHIPVLGRLVDAAMFNPDYLHLDREGRHLDANAT